MSQPPPYAPVTSFITYQAQQAWFPGQNLDVEFNAIETSILAIEANLKLIQRDDGGLANGIVGWDQLTGTLQVQLVNQGFVPTTPGVFSNLVVNVSLTIKPTNNTTPLPIADGQVVLVQSGTRSAFNIYGPSAPAGTFIYSNVRSVIDLEPGFDVQNYCAYDAFVYNNVVWNPLSVPHAHAGVGLEVYCVNAVAGAASFGFNPAFTDSLSGTTPSSVASTMVAGEADFSMYNSGSSVTGWSFVIQGVAAAGGGGAVVTQALINAATQAQWTNGYTIADGALKAGGAGLLLGVQGLTPAAATQSSGSIVFNHTDTSAATQHVFIQAQPNGSGNSALAIYNFAAPNGFNFIMQAAGTAPILALSGSDTDLDMVLLARGVGKVRTTTAFQAPTIYGGSAAGSILTLQSTSSGSPSADGVQVKIGGAVFFDCNVTNSGYVTVKSVNGLAVNGLSIIQVATLDANNAAGYRLAAVAASATVPTLLPNKASTTTGIGAQASGNVSIIAAATELARFTTANIFTLVGAILGGTATGAGTVTYTAAGGLQIGAPTGGDKGSGTINMAGALFNTGTQVVTARQTGWTVATGTPQRTTFTTSGVTLAQLAGVVMALEQDLITHGLIGT